MTSHHVSRSKIEYFDFSMAIINTIILIMITILVHSSILLTVFNLISIAALCGLVSFTYIKRNPYYVIVCYGMAILGLIFSISSAFMPEIPFYSCFSVLFIVIFILDICYVGSLIKGSASSRSKVANVASIKTIIEPGTDTPTYIKDRHEALEKDKPNRNDELKIKKKIRKKQRALEILIITLIVGVVLFTSLVFSIFFY